MRRLRNFLREWLGVDDKVSFTTMEQTIELVDEQIERVKNMTVTNNGDSIARNVERCIEQIYAIKEYLGIEVKYEEKEDEQWAEMNKQYIRYPVARKKDKNGK